MKTLEEARDGLIDYLQSRPDGGSRAELLAAASARGFEEPLLNKWLDVFLTGLVNLGYLDTPDYDGALAPRVSAIGVDRAVRAIRTVYNTLVATGAELFPVRLEADVQILNDRIAAADLRLSQLDQGRAWVLDNAPSSPTRNLVIESIDRFADLWRRRRLGLVDARDGFQSQIDAARE